MAPPPEPSRARARARELQPADLRGILEYVPMWRDHTFVVALDGAIVDGQGLGSIAVEVAVLHNLGIRLVLSYGIGGPMAEEARRAELSITDAKGEGPVDPATLGLAVRINGQVQHHLLQALTQNRIPCAVPNAVRATERGVIGGVDQALAGKVDRVDGEALRALLQQGMVPVLGPIAFDRDGQALRLNSDELASGLAVAMGASKLIFLQPHTGLTLRGEFQLNLSVEELEQRLAQDPGCIDEAVGSKGRWAIKTIRAGVPRAHLLDARLPDALLTEIFSTVGVGTMIHANPYAEIRPAQKVDARAIHRLTKVGAKDEALRRRTQEEIERAAPSYFVYEIDGTIVGCGRLAPIDEAPGALELMSLYVQPTYGGRGIGRALVEWASDRAREKGAERLFAASTQTAPFFTRVCGFEEAGAEAPNSVRARIVRESRNGRVLMRRL